MGTWGEQSTQFELSQILWEHRKGAARQGKQLFQSGKTFVTCAAQALAATDPEGKTEAAPLAWLLQHFCKGSTLNVYAPTFDK